MSGFYAEIVGVVILGILIARYIAPYVRRALDQRRQTIASAIEGAQATRAAAQKELARRKVLLAEAKTEVAGIVAQATTTAGQVREDAHQRGKQDYERIVHDARIEIDLERQRARDEVTSEIGAIVMTAAEKVVRVEIDAARQRVLVAEVIATAEGSRAGA